MTSDELRSCKIGTALRYTLEYKDIQYTSYWIVIDSDDNGPLPVTKLLLMVAGTDDVYYTGEEWSLDVDDAFHARCMDLYDP